MLHTIPIPEHPWKQIGVDVCCLPKTEEGYVAMVVAVDYFTKWVEAEPIRDKTAATIAHFLLKLICRHGCAEIQINDQGREFVNQVSSTLHSLTGVKQRITSAYHPQANGLTERNNRTIQSSLLRVLSVNQDEWVKALPGVLFAYRTSVQKSTGYTPFFLMYGRQAKLPIECESLEVTESDDTPAALILDEADDSELQARLKSITQLQTAIAKDASDNVLKAQDRQKRDYAKRHSNKKPFAVGDAVLLWNLRRADRKGGRMKDPWLGPYKVGRDCGNGTYELINQEGVKVQQKAHGVNLKLFNQSQCLGHQNVNECKRELIERNDVEHIDNDDSRDSSINKSEVTITHTSIDEVFSFQPTTAKWRKDQCEKLGLPPPQRTSTRKNKNSLGKPKQVNSMVGDGNCFFRSISYELCGTAEQHDSVRDAIVRYMSDDVNERIFSEYANKSVRGYLDETKMANSGIWATDVEITATATLLQTSIYVYSDVTDKRKWYRYKPLLPDDNTCNSMNIYLTNLNQHFERVVDVE
jgi:hypothetical protein